MANVSQQIPTFLGGVSRKPDFDKTLGQVVEANNIYPDETYGMLKRPGTEFTGNLGIDEAEAADTYFFPIIREGRPRYLCGVSDKSLKMWDLDNPARPITVIVEDNALDYLTYSNFNNISESQAYRYASDDRRTIVVNRTMKCLESTTKWSAASPPFIWTNRTQNRDANSIEDLPDGRAVRIKWGVGDPDTNLWFPENFRPLRPGIHYLPLSVAESVENRTTGVLEKITNQGFGCVIKCTIDDRGLIPYMGASRGNVFYPSAYAAEKDSQYSGQPTYTKSQAAALGATNFLYDAEIWAAGSGYADQTPAYVDGVPGSKCTIATGLQPTEVYRVVNSGANNDDFYMQPFSNTTDEDDDPNAPPTDRARLDGPYFWKECPSPDALTGFNKATLPHELIDNEDGTFTFRQVDYSERWAGDDVNNPAPSFVNHTINNVFFLNNRLGFLCEDNVILSRPINYGPPGALDSEYVPDDNPWIRRNYTEIDFFRQSAIGLSAADPIDMKAANNNTSIFHTVISTPQGVILFADGQQSLLYQPEGLLSPLTASINSLSNYDMTSDINAVIVGETYYFINKSQKFCKIYSMVNQGMQNPPIIEDVTKEVADWLPNDITDLVACPTDGMIFCYNRTRDAIYCMRTLDTNNSWTKWTLPSSIYNVVVDHDIMYFVTNSGTDTTISKARLYVLPDDYSLNRPPPEPTPEPEGRSTTYPFTNTFTGNSVSQFTYTRTDQRTEGFACGTDELIGGGYIIPNDGSVAFLYNYETVEITKHREEGVYDEVCYVDGTVNTETVPVYTVRGYNNGVLEFERVIETTIGTSELTANDEPVGIYYTYTKSFGSESPVLIPPTPEPEPTIPEISCPSIINGYGSPYAKAPGGDWVRTSVEGDPFIWKFEIHPDNQVITDFTTSQWVRKVNIWKYNGTYDQSPTVAYMYTQVPSSGDQADAEAVTFKLVPTVGTCSDDDGGTTPEPTPEPTPGDGDGDDCCQLCIYKTDGSVATTGISSSEWYTQIDGNEVVITYKDCNDTFNPQDYAYVRYKGQLSNPENPVYEPGNTGINCGTAIDSSGSILTNWEEVRPDIAPYVGGPTFSGYWGAGGYTWKEGWLITRDEGLAPGSVTDNDGTTTWTVERPWTAVMRVTTTGWSGPARNYVGSLGVFNTSTNSQVVVSPTADSGGVFGAPPFRLGISNDSTSPRTVTIVGCWQFSNNANDVDYDDYDGGWKEYRVPLADFDRVACCSPGPGPGPSPTRPPEVIIDPYLDIFAEPTSVAGNVITPPAGFPLLEGVPLCYLITNLPGGDYVNSDRIGFTGDITVSSDGSFIADRDIENFEGTLIIGYRYNYQLILPNLYVARQDGNYDYTASLTVARMKFGLGFSGTADFQIMIKNSDVWEQMYSQIVSNDYYASTAPLKDPTVVSIPTHKRNTDFRMQVSSDSPFPLSVDSCMWEGNYSPRYYRRI